MNGLRTTAQPSQRANDGLGDDPPTGFGIRSGLITHLHAITAYGLNYRHGLVSLIEREEQLVGGNDGHALLLLRGQGAGQQFPHASRRTLLHGDDEDLEEPRRQALLNVLDLVLYRSGNRDLARYRPILSFKEDIDASCALQDGLFNRRPVTLGLGPPLHELLEVLVLGATSARGRRNTPNGLRLGHGFAAVRRRSVPGGGRPLLRLPSGRFQSEMLCGLRLANGGGHRRRLRRRRFDAVTLPRESGDLLLPRPANLFGHLASRDRGQVEIRIRPTYAADGLADAKALEVSRGEKREPFGKLRGVVIAHAERDTDGCVPKDGGGNVSVLVPQLGELLVSQHKAEAELPRTRQEGRHGGGHEVLELVYI